MTDKQEKTGTELEKIMKSPRENKNDTTCRRCFVSLSTGNKREEAVIHVWITKKKYSMRTTERLKAQRSETPWEEVNGDNSWRKVKTKGQKEMKRIRKLCEKKPKRRIENQSYKAKVRSKGQRPTLWTNTMNQWPILPWIQTLRTKVQEWEANTTGQRPEMKTLSDIYQDK